MSFLKIPQKFMKNLEKDKNIGSLTWFKAGGNCDYFFQPESVKMLEEFLKYKSNNIGSFNIKYKNQIKRVKEVWLF